MDTAWVNDIPVRIKKQSGGLIVGYIPEGVTFSQENNVVARVDKEKRQRYAALHTAGHLLNWELRRLAGLHKKAIIFLMNLEWNLA